MLLRVSHRWASIVVRRRSAPSPGADARDARQAGRVSDSEVSAGRIQRLRHELRDEQIRVPDDPDLADLLLAELDYARHPHAHEGTAPSYGALIATGLSAHEHRRARQFHRRRHRPPGRASSPGRRAVVVRRARRRFRRSADVLRPHPRVRVVRRAPGDRNRRRRGPAARSGLGPAHHARRESPRGTGSDGPRSRSASASPSASRRCCRAPTPTVLANLVEFSTHWLGAGRVGAAIVWRLDGDARELGGLGFGSAVEIPPLDLTDRTHFAPLLNALAQYDRAALVDGNGCVVDGRGASADLGTIAPRHRTVPRDSAHVGLAVLRRRAERGRVRRVLGRRADGRTATVDASTPAEASRSSTPTLGVISPTLRTSSSWIRRGRRAPRRSCVAG